jgi:hypothetical protein
MKVIRIIIDYMFERNFLRQKQDEIQKICKCGFTKGIAESNVAPAGICKGVEAAWSARHGRTRRKLIFHFLLGLYF